MEELFAFDEKSLCDKYRLLARHVKVYYENFRGCMIANQQKELEELDETNRIERQYLIDELNSQHRSFIKYMKQLKRSREQQYKQSLDDQDPLTTCWMQTVQGQSVGTPVVNVTSGSQGEVKAKLRQFSENENMRIQGEIRRREEYMRQKLEQLFANHQQRKAQLHCQQAEKRSKCCDKEAQKLAQLQRAFQMQLHDLQQFHEVERSKLKNELSHEIKNKEAFYRSTVQALSPQKPPIIKVGIPQQNYRTKNEDNSISEGSNGPEIESSQQF
ncbi:hypothetical protein ACOME3_009356 [Neoechinorhynchus agilis]